MTAPAPAERRADDRGSATGEHYDLLRVLAAFMVFAGHQRALTGRPEPAFLGFVTWGEVAVGTFFALSGYLVSESWRRDPSVPRYLARRGLRLLPGLFGVVLLSCLVLGPIVSRLGPAAYFRHSQTWDYLRNLALDVRFSLPGVFAENPVANVVNGSLWTLPMEMACYLVFLLLLRTLRRVPVGALLWAVAFALWAIDFSVAKSPPRVLYGTDWLMAAHFGAYFFTGAALRLAPPPGFRPIPAAMLAAATLMFLAHSHAGYWSATLAVPLLVIGVARVSALPSRWAARFGDLSYGLYLYAFPVQQLFVASGYAADYPRRAFVLSWLTIVLCAFLSWHLVEKPAMRLKPRGGSRASVPAAS